MVLLLSVLLVTKPRYVLVTPRPFHWTRPSAQFFPLQLIESLLNTSKTQTVIPFLLRHSGVLSYSTTLRLNKELIAQDSLGINHIDCYPPSGQNFHLHVKYLEIKRHITMKWIVAVIFSVWKYYKLVCIWDIAMIFLFVFSKNPQLSEFVCLDYVFFLLFLSLLKKKNLFRSTLTSF